MEIEPSTEWQRLTRHYGEMYDEELSSLAVQYSDLTELARQVLRDEMRRRGLGDPGAPPGSATRPPVPRFGEDGNLRDLDDASREDGSQPEYTWKTQLCECEEQEQALQLFEVLKRAGIECWIERPGWSAINPAYLRVLVAADQLEQAREVASRPIPQEIVDESRTNVPEFELPHCPRCGAEDPVLTSVDPANVWECEACGHQWTESSGALDEKTGASF
jgi:hypothetical protein